MQLRRCREKLNAINQLSMLPRHASAVRLRNRCFVTGRPRGYYRMFGVSRIVLRQMANAGRVPGANRSSW
ncbi:MAG: 30S ribosomal protein S14 [Candidatus Hodgkinia cicadicola]